MTSYSAFFTTSATVAGALVGLLFVALSVAPERTTGPEASVEQQAIAGTAYYALIDSLWISLFALLPTDPVPVASLILGILGLVSTGALIARLWRARAKEKLSRRWPLLLFLIVGLYAFQVGTAVVVHGRKNVLSTASTLVFFFFGVGIARSWELLGQRGGGVIAVFTDLLEHRKRGSKGGEEDDAGPLRQEAR